MNRLRTVPLTVLTLLLWGCQGTDSPEAPAPAIAADPVVVYASYADTTYLPRLFEDFTKETGIIVIVRHGEPDAMVNDVIDGHISPPADVLLTRSVAGVARAADEGALRPLQSPVAIEQVAPWLRDVDGFWTALNYRRAVLAYDTDRVDFDELTDALRRMGLVAAQDAPKFAPLTGGVSSDIWRVDLAGGPICIKRALPKLKVAADWQAPVSRNARDRTNC